MIALAACGLIKTPGDDKESLRIVDSPLLLEYCPQTQDGADSPSCKDEDLSPHHRFAVIPSAHIGRPLVERWRLITALVLNTSPFEGGTS
jgi:hypothetical protein